MELGNRILKEQISNETVSHAYLLVSSSEEQLIKESEGFVYSLFDEVGKNKFLSGNNVDFLRVVPENRNIKIAMVREIIKFLSTSPVESNYKIVLIENGELFRKESANALLKILEEPPKYGKIIITTNNEEQIIKTILSRCQVINLESIKNITESVNEDLNEILINSINRKLLELSRSKNYFNDNKDSANSLYNYIYNFFYDIYIYKNTLNKTKLNYVDNFKIYEDIKVFTNENLINILDKIEFIRNNFKNNVNFQLSNEELLLYIMEEQNGRGSRSTL